MSQRLTTVKEIFPHKFPTYKVNNPSKTSHNSNNSKVLPAQSAYVLPFHSC